MISKNQANFVISKIDFVISRNKIYDIKNTDFILKRHHIHSVRPDLDPNRLVLR